MCATSCKFCLIILKMEEMGQKALKLAKAIGGKKFHNKQYGGGIVFQSHNIHETENAINKIIGK